MAIDLLEKLVDRDVIGKVNFRLWEETCWPEDNLDTAQERDLNYICRKSRL